MRRGLSVCLGLLVCGFSAIHAQTTDGTLNLGSTTAVTLAPTPVSFENPVWISATVNSFLLRTPEDTTLLSFTGNGYADVAPFLSDYGGKAEITLTRGFIRDLSVLNFSGYGSFDGAYADRLVDPSAGVAVDWSYGGIGSSVGLAVRATRHFLSSAGWSARLSARGDVSLSPSWTASLLAIASGALYDAGETLWSAGAGPIFTWYAGPRLIVDLSIRGLLQRSDLMTPLSDFGVSGALGTVNVEADQYVEARARVSLSFAATRTLRFHFAVPASWRLMTYGHVTGQIMTDPAEWVVQMRPSLDVAIDLAPAISLHVVPEYELDLSNSDYRRASVARASVFFRYHF